MNEADNHRDDTWRADPWEAPAAADDEWSEDIWRHATDDENKRHEEEIARLAQEEGRARLAQEEERRRAERETVQEGRRTLNLTGLGTLMVLGAVSANVFAFRSSRWAVGKELHRAWERRERYRAAAQSQAFRGGGVGAAASRVAREAARAAAARAAAEAARAAAKAAARQAFRASAEAARRQGRAEARWESWGASSGGASWRSSGRIEAEDIEEMLRKMGGRRGAAPGLEQLLDEIMRGMGQTGASGSRDERAEADAKAFWEEVMRGPGGPFSGAGGGFSGADGNPFSGDGMGNGRHYRTLGLEDGADLEAVKRQYRRLVMQWHPDRYRGSEPEQAARKFREITQAYQAITKR